MTLKEELFNRDTVSLMLSHLPNDFDKNEFLDKAVQGFIGKELKERITVLTDLLHKAYPDFLSALHVFDNVYKNTDFHFVYASILEYVETYGCNDEYLDESLKRLGLYTGMFSSEFAIRPFINKYPEKTMEAVLEWSKSENVDTRRLASEGTRPKLPWAMGITLDYRTTEEVLDNLYSDTERFVTRSVANHLNDISKIDPDFVLRVLTKWKEENKQEDTEMKYIINHSLRTLVKRGHKDTLSFLGYGDYDIEIENVVVNDVKIEDYFTFGFDVLSNKDQSLVVDYAIHFITKNSKTSRKVYKISTMHLKQGERKSINKKVKFNQKTTRTYYPGTHKFEIQVNGDVVLERDFEVKS